MGRLFIEHLGGKRMYVCRKCNTYLTNKDEMVSNRFTGATGRAYLFDRVVNLEYSEMKARSMITGEHFVRDVSCKVCKTKVGWMYEFAFEKNEQYKENRVILEKKLIKEEKGFDDPLNGGDGTEKNQTITSSESNSSSSSSGY
uniref:Protein yippee-like n=1 Tax=Parastrongyloides trichosuri TaxID=131310 RepID=A0A0N4ZB22_PARTI